MQCKPRNNRNMLQRSLLTKFLCPRILTRKISGSSFEPKANYTNLKKKAYLNEILINQICIKQSRQRPWKEQILSRTI